MFLDLGREPEQRKNLGHPGPGPALSPGDLGLGPDVTGVKLVLPLLGHSEELDHPGHLGLLGGLGRPPGLGGPMHDSVSGNVPFQGANAPVFERPLGPEGDFDGLFVQLGPRKGVVAVRCDV